MIGCTCAHCWRRNQGDKIDRNILPSFIIDNMAYAADSSPDTLPSWPPPRDADAVHVRDPNSTELEYGVFGPPDEEELRLLRNRDIAQHGGGLEDGQVLNWEYSNESTAAYGKLNVPQIRRVMIGAGIWTWEHDDPDHTRIGNWYRITGRRAVHIEGRCRWERQDMSAIAATASGSERDARAKAATCSGSASLGMAESGAPGTSKCDDVMEDGEGLDGEPEEAKGDGWMDRARGSGWVFCNSSGVGLEESEGKERAVEDGAEGGAVPAQGRLVKVIDSVLRGGWFMSEETAGSMFHVVRGREGGREGGRERQRELFRRECG